jgi:hypothetical protein
MKIGFMFEADMEAIPKEDGGSSWDTSGSLQACAYMPNSYNPLSGAVKTEFSTSNGPALSP